MHFFELLSILIFVNIDNNSLGIHMKSTYFCLLILLLILGFSLNYLLYSSLSRLDLIGYNCCYLAICFLIFISFKTGSKQLAESYTECTNTAKSLALTYNLDEEATQLLIELMKLGCNKTTIYKFISDCLLNGRSKEIIKPDSNYPLYIYKYRQ